MKIRTNHRSIAAISLFTLFIATQVQAGAPAQQVRRIVRQANQRIGRSCPQPQPCPQPGPIGDPYPAPTPLPGPYPQPSTYFLGVYTSTVPVDQGGSLPDGPQLQVVPGYGQQVYGQRVNQIVPNSPAFHAGLEEGDIILHANGYPMDSRQQLQAAIDTSEGYLEMQVRDARSGQIVWVVAETDPQNSVPMAAASRKQAPQNVPSSRTLRNSQRTNATAPTASSNRSSGRPASRLQTRPTPPRSNALPTGSRRAPVRRR